jgi:hypothetical protein
MHNPKDHGVLGWTGPPFSASYIDWNHFWWSQAGHIALALVNVWLYTINPFIGFGFTLGWIIREVRQFLPKGKGLDHIGSGKLDTPEFEKLPKRIRRCLDPLVDNVVYFNTLLIGLFIVWLI